MSLTTIKTAISAKIAAVTSATPSDELSILAVLAKKLGLSTTNLTTSANTASDSATVSSDLTDLVLWNQTIEGYGGKSYIGEKRAFSDLMPVSFVTEDGASWLKQGYFETDPTKVKKEVFPYACVGNTGVNNTGVSNFTTPTNNMIGEVVQLNSGKFISFSFGGAAAADIVAFIDPELPGTQLLASAGTAVDYSYDQSTDTLYILRSTSVLYKITNDGTVITTIASATHGVTSAYSVLAVNGIVYVGGSTNSTALRKSTDGGTTWGNTSITGLPATRNLLRMAYDTSLNKLFMFWSSSSAMSRTTSVSYELYVAISEGAASLVGPASYDGFMYPLLNINNNLVLLNDYTNGTTATHTVRGIKQGATTIPSQLRQVSSNILTDGRSKLIYVKNKDYFVFMYFDTGSVTKIEIVLDFFVSPSSIALATITDFLMSESTTGMSRTSLLLYNETLYFKRLTQSTLTFKKVPTYGIASTNTPVSHLRIL